MLQVGFVKLFVQDVPKNGGLKFWLKIFENTLLGTNISPEKSISKMIFLFPRWDMLISWSVLYTFVAWIDFAYVSLEQRKRPLRLGQAQKETFIFKASIFRGYVLLVVSGPKKKKNNIQTSKHQFSGAMFY